MRRYDAPRIGIKNFSTLLGIGTNSSLFLLPIRNTIGTNAMTTELTATTTDLQLSPRVSVSRIMELHGASVNDNTMSTRASHLRMMADYCASNGWTWSADDAVPFRVDWFVSHITELFDAGKSLSTIDGRMDAIAWWSARRGVASPVTDDVKALRVGFQNTRAKENQEGAHIAGCAQAITREQLHAMIARCDSMVRKGKAGELIRLRDRAILLMGWHGAFRRSELATLSTGNVDTWRFAGRDGLVCKVYNTKTNKTTSVDKQIDRMATVQYCPVTAYNEWIAAAGIVDGPVFRSITKGGVVGTAVSDRTIDNVVRAYAGGDYSAHSLRAGFATQSVLDNINGEYARLQGGWSPTSGVFARYATRAQVGQYARVRVI